jgi:hypothetical protein
VQFWETSPWAPPSTFEFSQLVVFIYTNYVEINGAGMGPCYHCRTKKENPRVQCKCHVEQILSSSGMCLSLALGPRKPPGWCRI